MPMIYLKLWDKHDTEFCSPLIYGKNGKKRKRPATLKPSPWQKVKDGYADLFTMLWGK